MRNTEDNKRKFRLQKNQKKYENNKKNKSEKDQKDTKQKENFFKKISERYKRNRANREYEKELNKEGRTTKSRHEEYGPYRRVENKLNIAIGIVSVLLIIVLLFVFFV